MRTTDVVDRPWRSGTLACVAMMGWLSVVLWLDRASAGGGLAQQRLLGVATWLVLLVALRRVSPMVRAQTAVVVVFATVVEYVFSPTLEVYLYRFDNVPMYVPPGHGLVYLSAYALGHARVVRATPAGLHRGRPGRGRPLGRLRPVPRGAAGRARRVLVRVPGRLPAAGPVHAGVRRGVRRGQLPRARRHRAAHLGVAEPGPHRLGLDRQPALGRRGRLRLVRPGRAAGGAVPRRLVRPAAAAVSGPADGGVSPRRRRSRPTGPARPEPVRPGAVDVH